MSLTFTYKKTNETELKAELYPVQIEHAPLIVYIHGGGLIWGTRKDMNKEQIELYNNNGYNVLSIAYRLAPETKLSEIKIDIKDALQWVNNELPKEVSFNKNKVIVIGSSAGGYLALLSGTFAVKPKAIISFYGYGNITSDWYSHPSSHFNKMPKVNEALAKQLIKNTEIAEAPITSRYAIYLYLRQQGAWLDYVADAEVRNNITEYCPVQKITKDYPPTLLLHGDQDDDVPYSESALMQQALEKNQVTNSLITISGGEHQFDENMDDPQTKNAFLQVLQFIKNLD